MPQGLDADGRTALVRRLLSGALPGAADQPLRRLTTSGTEHDVWRIGADLVLRLPRDADAETGLRKESAWWPLLRPHLPEWLAVPEIVHAGE